MSGTIQQSLFELSSTSGATIRGNVHLPANRTNAPVVIFCHGFKGFKDWGVFPHLMDVLAEDGWIAIRFNFSLNGIGDDPMNFTELDNFERNTYSHELDDLEQVIRAVVSKRIVPDVADVSRLALIGHSRGGGIVLTKASENPVIRAVATLAPMCVYYRWGEKTKDEWRRQGYLEVTNSRTNQKMKMGVGLLYDVENNLPRFDLNASAARLRIPALMIHGEQDATISIEEARSLFSAADNRYLEMEILPHADHTFGIKHPYEGSTPEFGKALERLQSWLKANTLPG